MYDSLFVRNDYMFAKFSQALEIKDVNALQKLNTIYLKKNVASLSESWSITMNNSDTSQYGAVFQ